MMYSSIHKIEERLDTAAGAWQRYSIWWAVYMDQTRDGDNHWTLPWLIDEPLVNY